MPSILKFYYRDVHKHIVWGFVGEEMTEDYLHLYKTGRTNANDGGIDFVMTFVAENQLYNKITVQLSVKEKRE